MPRTRQAVAQHLADRLFAAESAIDEALTRAAELNAAMPQARAEARLPAMIGQNALTRAAEAYATLVEARRLIIEAHAALDEARAQIGLKEVNAGDLTPKVPGLFTTAEEKKSTTAHLRAVS